MIEINGKIYRNIQEQVAKNQEDIKNLQDKYRHRILISYDEGDYNEFVIFDIINDKPEAYTTLNDILNAIGNNIIIAIQGWLSIGGLIYQVAKNGSNLRVYYLLQSDSSLNYKDMDITTIEDQVI
jgi:hypothetical protein